MYIRSLAKTLQNRKQALFYDSFKRSYTYFKTLIINLLKTTVYRQKRSLYMYYELQKNKAINHPEYFKPVYYYNTYILRSCKEMRNVIICL